MHWRAAVGAGLIAGIVFLMYEMVMLPLFLGDLAGLQLASYSYLSARLDGILGLRVTTGIGHCLAPPPANRDLEGGDLDETDEERRGERWPGRLTARW